jgi:nucleoside-diphosphate-sugar epimerase
MTDWNQLHGGAFGGARCLVTGGAGFIGSHLVEALTSLGAHVVVLDNLVGGDRLNIDRFKPELIEGSILDDAALARAARGCRYVFHLAALGSVPHSVERPIEYHDVDATGTLKVLQAARDAKAQRVM